MGTEKDTRTPWIVVIILAIVALSINGMFSVAGRNASRQVSLILSPSSTPTRENQSNVDRDALAARQASENHSKELRRYLTGNAVRRSDKRTMTVVIVGDNGIYDRGLTDLFANKFKPAPVEILTSFFTPEFVSDGVFSEAFNDAIRVARRLELTNTLDIIFLGQQLVNYSTNSDLQNVITAHMELQLTGCRFAKGVQSPVMAYRADGAGFTTRDARAQAQARLIEQIESDPSPQP